MEGDTDIRSQLCYIHTYIHTSEVKKVDPQINAHSRNSETAFKRSCQDLCEVVGSQLYSHHPCSLGFPEETGTKTGKAKGE